MMNSIFNLQNYYANVYALPHFIVGVLISLEGIYVFSQSKKVATHIAYLVTTVTAGIWLTGVGIACSISNETMALTVSRYYTWFGIIFITPAVYFFSAAWNAELLIRKKKYIYFNYFTAIVFYIICIASSYLVDGLYAYSTGYFPKAGPLEPIFIVWFYSIMMLSFINFIRTYQESKTAVARKNIKLVFTAFVIAFFSSVEYLPNYGINIFPWAFLPMFIFTTIIGYCVIRYKLLDIETVIHKTLMWLITTILTILPFVGIAYSLQDLMSDKSPVAITISLVLFTTIFYFYFRMVKPRLDHLFQRKRANLEKIADNFSSELVHLKDLRDLLQMFVRTLRRTIYVGQVSVYLTDETQNQLVPVISKRIRGLKPISFDHPFIKWIEKRDEAVIGELAVSDPDVQSFKDDLENYFNDLHAKVAMPLVLNDKLMGMVHLGKRINLKKYGGDEIHFLTQLKSTVTIAFSNSQRFEKMSDLYTQVSQMSEELKEWNQELEKRVEDRTKELVETQNQLTQAEKLATLGILAGGVAHEINNPLTAVLTNAQILKMDAPEKDIDSLDLIEEGAKRCQSIVQKLMKYARKPLESEKVKLVNVNKVITNVIGFLKYQLDQEDIEFIYKETPGLSEIEGNSNELEQVLTNLILNAKDAIKQSSGRGKIEIKTEEKAKQIKITVSDNGIGIPKENVSKIFDPFFTTKEIGKGTGLGLSVTFGIIEKHKGKIEVSSDLGNGTTFIVSLPILEGFKK